MCKSRTHLNDAAANHVLVACSLDARLRGNDQDRDVFAAQVILESPLRMLWRCGIIVRARSNKYTEGSALAVYVDVSASMTREKVAKALGVLRSARKLKRVSLLEFYFSDRVRDTFFAGGGTNYDAVFQHAMQNKYSCIAIITDDSEAKLSQSYTFDAVWIAGVEYGDADSYGVGRCINRGKSRDKRDSHG